MICGDLTRTHRCVASAHSERRSGRDLSRHSGRLILCGMRAHPAALCSFSLSALCCVQERLFLLRVVGNAWTFYCAEISGDLLHTVASGRGALTCGHDDSSIYSFQGLPGAVGGSAAARPWLSI